ncbi:MAG: hypothetical protein ACPLYD_16360, partial [Anaerolineae bacterium]
VVGKGAVSHDAGIQATILGGECQSAISVVWQSSEERGSPSGNIVGLRNSEERTSALEGYPALSPAY